MRIMIWKNVYDLWSPCPVLVDTSARCLLGACGHNFATLPPECRSSLPTRIFHTNSDFARPEILAYVTCGCYVIVHTPPAPGRENLAWKSKGSVGPVLKFEILFCDTDDESAYAVIFHH